MRCNTALFNVFLGRAPNVLSSHISLCILAVVGSTGQAYAAPIIVQQTDGSVSVGTGTNCNNLCAPVVVGSQIFTPTASGNLGSLEVFTANFSTGSLNPSANQCYINLYDEDTSTFIATSGNTYFGFGCAGDLMFTFYGSQPLLQVGTHYRWDYLMTGLFPTITFLGSASNTVGGIFSVPPVVNAEFTAFAMIEQPTSLLQSSGTTIPESGITSASSVTLSAVLPAVSPDSLQLQVELEPT
jgi:hypothetical protein